MSEANAEDFVKSDAETQRVESEVRDTRDRHWFWIDDEVIDECGEVIGCTGVALYALLCRCSNQSQQCWPSHPFMMQKLGLSKPTVIFYLDVLEESGLIEIKERQVGGNGPQLPNLYTLLPRSKRDLRRGKEFLLRRKENQRRGKEDSSRRKTDELRNQSALPEQDISIYPISIKQTNKQESDDSAAVAASAQNAPNGDATQSKTENSKPDELTRSLISRMAVVGVEPNIAAALIAQYGLENCTRQLEALPRRKADEPERVLVASIQGNYDIPKPKGKNSHQTKPVAPEIASPAPLAAPHQTKDDYIIEHEREVAETMQRNAAKVEQLNAVWESLNDTEKREIEAQAKQKLGFLAQHKNNQAALESMRRSILEQRLG